jgi:hypothetical protein
MTPVSDPFDPTNLRLNGTVFAPQEPVPIPPKRPPRHRPGQWFLRGPVPWTWLEAAARLPGKALPLGLCLWREVGRHRCRTVRLCLRNLTMGIDRHTARRALRALESAGLVAVARKPGRGVEVTLLEAGDEK